MPPSQNDNEQYPYSFENPPPEQQRFGANAAPTGTAHKQQPRRAKNQDEESDAADIADEVLDAFDIPQRLLGCAWWSMTLPFRLIGKLFSLFD